MASEPDFSRFLPRTPSHRRQSTAHGRHLTAAAGPLEEARIAWLGELERGARGGVAGHRAGHQLVKGTAPLGSSSRAHRALSYVCAVDAMRRRALGSATRDSYVKLASELGLARDRIDTIDDFPSIEKYGVKGDGGADRGERGDPRRTGRGDCRGRPVVPHLPACRRSRGVHRGRGRSHLWEDRPRPLTNEITGLQRRRLTGLARTLIAEHRHTWISGEPMTSEEFVRRAYESSEVKVHRQLKNGHIVRFDRSPSGSAILGQLRMLGKLGAVLRTHDAAHA